MEKFILSMIAFTLVMVFAGCGVKSKFVATTEEPVNVVWSNTYGWEMGGDYVYVGSDGKIYEEREMEDPLFTPSGACFETYTGEQFTEEELDELLSIDIDDRDAQKELLRKKGVKFGKY